MRFQLIDQIVSIVPGKQLRAVKNLTLGEEYLADHFPSFPVMPGVLMLEALVQAGAWLVRATDDFAHSMIVLRETRTVKYGHFVEPGRQLELTVVLSEVGEGKSNLLTFKGNGEVEGKSTVTARFTVERYNLGDRSPELAELDEKLRSHYRSQFKVLWPSISQVSPAAG